MRRSLQYLLGGLVALQAGSTPVVGHEQESGGGPTWLLWGKLTLVVLGAGCVAVGVYIDQNRGERSRYVDYLIIAGFLLTIAGGISLYR